jgi:hypothetical protein
VPLLTLLSVLTFMGLYRAWKQKGPDAAAPYALVLIFFPIVYYLTHGGGWYRCPMDPFLIALGSYEVHSRAVMWLNRSRPSAPSTQDHFLPEREGDRVALNDNSGDPAEEISC